MEHGEVLQGRGLDREGGSTGKEAMEGRGLYKERDSTGKGAGQEHVIEDTCMHHISHKVYISLRHMQVNDTAPP